MVSVPFVSITRLSVSSGWAGLNISNRNVKGRAYLSQFINCIFFVNTPECSIVDKLQIQKYTYIKKNQIRIKFIKKKNIQTKLLSKSTYPIGFFSCSSLGFSQ